MLRNKRGRDSERPAHHDEEWPPLAATREKALAQKRRPNTAINKLKKKKNPLFRDLTVKHNEVNTEHALTNLLLN